MGDEKQLYSKGQDWTSEIPDLGKYFSSGNDGTIFHYNSF